ncbi:MAG: tol-pal system protein YbgF, partial [Pseudomonadota bacterium]
QLKALIERQLEDLIFRVTELEGGDLASVGPVDLGTPAQTSPAPVILSEQADLDRARLDIQQGRFDQGEGRLRDFIADYPSSNLVGEAHYWLGQSQFTRGDFAGAATAYLSGFRTAETGPYASDNLFQLGVTLGRLGQIEPACSTLREVGRRFPNASSTIRDGARSELASLDCG